MNDIEVKISMVMKDEEKLTNLLDTYDMYKDTNGCIARVAFLRCQAMLGRWREEGDFEKLPALFGDSEGDEVAMELMTFLRVEDFNPKSGIRKECEEETKLLKKLELYLESQKEIIGFVSLKYVNDEGKALLGVGRKMIDEKWIIELETGEKIENLTAREMIDNEGIKIMMPETNECNRWKKSMTKAEREEEEKAEKVVLLGKDTVLFEEYKKCWKR